MDTFEGLSQSHVARETLRVTPDDAADQCPRYRSYEWAATMGSLRLQYVYKPERMVRLITGVWLSFRCWLGIRQEESSERLRLQVMATESLAWKVRPLSRLPRLRGILVSISAKHGFLLNINELLYPHLPRVDLTRSIEYGQPVKRFPDEARRACQTCQTLAHSPSDYPPGILNRARLGEADCSPCDYKNENPVAQSRLSVMPYFLRLPIAVSDFLHYQTCNIYDIRHTVSGRVEAGSTLSWLRGVSIAPVPIRQSWLQNLALLCAIQPSLALSTSSTADSTSLSFDWKLPIVYGWLFAVIALLIIVASSKWSRKLDDSKLATHGVVAVTCMGFYVASDPNIPAVAHLR